VPFWQAALPVTQIGTWELLAVQHWAVVPVMRCLTAARWLHWAVPHWADWSATRYSRTAMTVMTVVAVTIGMTVAVVATMIAMTAVAGAIDI